ncbi:MAG TPA: hypothetical protein VMF89_25705, partial [Polyangiales bacterium]|nr:hypothetical protein [Polyangiales bacterium]
MSRSVASLATRSVARILCALGLLFALCACKSETPVRRLTGITPNSMPSDGPVEVTVEGEGFLGVPSVALMSSGTAKLNQTYRVELPPSDFYTEVTTDRATELTFTPPIDLPAADYDVRVVPPLGAALVLPGALHVTPASTASDAGTDGSVAKPDLRRLSLETSADGDGEVISARTLRLQEELTVYAVLREPDGSVSSAKVEFRVSRKLAERTDIQAQSCVIRALLPGTVTVAAVLGSLRAEAELTLIDDSANELADLHLSLENEPGGAGKLLSARRMENAGTLLTFYAVVRDKNDAF